MSTRVSRFTHGQGFHSGKVSAQAQFIPLNLIAQKKKGEPWPKSFTFSSLEGHSDPPPLQVPNTINFRRTDCAALLNTPCFCGVSLNWWYSALKKVSSNKKQIKNQIKKYRSKPDLYREEKIRTPYINPSQIKTTGILVEFDWQKGIIQTNNIAYLEWVAINECHFVTRLSSGIKEVARWTITDNTLHFNSQMRQYFKTTNPVTLLFLFFHLLRKFITNSNRVPLASGL